MFSFFFLLFELPSMFSWSNFRPEHNFLLFSILNSLTRLIFFRRGRIGLSELNLQPISARIFPLLYFRMNQLALPRSVANLCSNFPFALLRAQSHYSTPFCSQSLLEFLALLRFSRSICFARMGMWTDLFAGSYCLLWNAFFVA